MKAHVDVQQSPLCDSCMLSHAMHCLLLQIYKSSCVFSFTWTYYKIQCHVFSKSCCRPITVDIRSKQCTRSIDISCQASFINQLMWNWQQTIYSFIFQLFNRAKVYLRSSFVMVRKPVLCAHGVGISEGISVINLSLLNPQWTKENNNTVPVPTGFCNEDFDWTSFVT